MKTCMQCGTLLSDGAPSCGNCGWRAPEETIPPEGKSEETRPEGVAPPPAARPIPPHPAPAKKKSCLGCVLGVLALFFVFCIFAGSGFALWYFKGGGERFVKEKYEKVVHPPGTAPAGEEASPPAEAPWEDLPDTNGAYPEPETTPEVPPSPEEAPSSEPPSAESPLILVDRPALRAAKEKAEVAMKSLREAIEAAARAGAERVSGQAMDALREERRSAERAFQKAKSPSDFEAVASSARGGVSRALELKAQAEKTSIPEASPEGSGMRRSSPSAPPEPVTPPPKQPKASFGFIFETPVDGNKLILKVDGEKLIEQEFRAVQGSYRLARNFPIVPGQHHLRAAVHQADGKVVAKDWDFNFQVGPTPVFKVVLENSPRQMVLKKVQ